MTQNQLEKLGIDPVQGGATIVISGQIIKSDKWELTDTKTGEFKTGYAVHIAYMGGTHKLRTPQGHPVRDYPVGTNVVIAFPATNGGAGPYKQLGDQLTDLTPARSTLSKAS